MTARMPLIDLDIETAWICDDRGRLTRARTPEHRSAPLLLVALADGRVTTYFGSEIGDDRVDMLLDLVPRSDEHGDVGWAPRGAQQLVETLGSDVRVEKSPTFVLGDQHVRVMKRSGTRVFTSIDTDPHQLEGMLAESDLMTLQPPWAAVVVGTSVASVCETSRSHPLAMAAGLWTYPPFRGMGYATAATAAWCELRDDRTRFYSTDDTNLASLAVARAVGFTPLGHVWSLYANAT